LSICPFYLGAKPPRYVSASPYREPARQQHSWNVGYRITDRSTDGTAVYAPGIESWSHTLERHLEGADCIFLDGTFWVHDELRRLGASELYASDMGHLPVAGPGGSAERFANVPARRKVYVHINNTNPMLLEDSPERRTLTDLGIEIGFDGMEMEI